MQFIEQAVKPMTKFCRVKSWVKRVNAMVTSLQSQLSRPMGRAKAEAQAVHPQFGTLQTDSILNNPIFEPKMHIMYLKKKKQLKAIQ